MEEYNLDFKTHLKIKKILDSIIYNLENKIPLNNCKESISQISIIFENSKTIDSELSLHLNKLLKRKRIDLSVIKELRSLLDCNYQSSVTDEEHREYFNIYYK